jgi:NADH-ubiquinone oxidoreductase chain 1
MLGAVRGVAQTVSYEISLALILFSLLFTKGLTRLTNSSESRRIFILSSPLMVLWLISCVAETNRTPFDFSEGESELVSGFNVEYGGGLFAIIFMAEYGIILFLRSVTSILLISQPFGECQLALIALVFATIWVLARATYPRYRYDKLLNLAWKRFLPLRLARTLIYPVLTLLN